MNPSNVVYRLGALAVATIAAVIYLLPAFLSEESRPSFLPEDPIHLGLDLRGGTHLLFTVDVDKALENNVERTGDELGRALREEEVPVTSIEHEGVELTVQLESPDERQAFDEVVSGQFPSLELSSAGSLAAVKLTPSRREREQIKRLALDQSLETIRNRIDQFGVSEPIIQRQGSNDIVVQLPGVQDPERAKALIGRTAVLEFQFEADGSSGEETVTRRSSPQSGPGGQREYVLEKKVAMNVR